MVEDDDTAIKLKSALRLYTMQQKLDHANGRDFEEHAERRGHQSLVRDRKKLGFTLKLNYPEPKCINNQGEVFSDRQIKKQLKNALEILELIKEVPPWYSHVQPKPLVLYFNSDNAH